MVRKNDLNIVRRFKRVLSKKIPIKRMVLFGSRANGNVKKWSDFDLLIVSNKFKGIVSYKRSYDLYDSWTELYPVDFLCYTPGEFSELKKKITIVRQAVEEGIEI